MASVSVKAFEATVSAVEKMGGGRGGWKDGGREREEEEEKDSLSVVGYNMAHSPHPKEGLYVPLSSPTVPTVVLVIIHHKTTM